MKQNLNEEIKISQLKVLVAKYNTKRFSKFRYNLLLNFFILIILFQQLLINNLFSYINIIIYIIILMMSITIQGWVYFTKLDLYNYKNKFDNVHLRIYWYKELLCFCLSLYILMSTKINTNANILYLSIVCLLILINSWIYLWIKNIFLNNKDKYFNVVKQTYLSIPKKYR